MENMLKLDQIALGIGILLAVGWVALLVGAILWVAAWRWIDDDKGGALPHPIIVIVMKWLGYTRDRDSSCYPYQKNGGNEISDGDRAVFIPLVVLLVLPSAILWGFRLYPLVIGVVTLYLIARVARFARRHKKLFDKHLKDPEAHK